MEFFRRRIDALVAAGVARERLILDPGMGFFLSSRPEASFRMLAHLPLLKSEFSAEIFVGVSRKSFLRSCHRAGKSFDLSAATLAAELYAAAAGVDFIRTHDPLALATGLAVTAACGRARAADRELRHDLV